MVANAGIAVTASLLETTAGSGNAAWTSTSWASRTATAPPPDR